MSIADVWANPNEGPSGTRLAERRKLERDVSRFLDSGGEIEIIELNQEYFQRRKHREKAHSWSSQREKTRAYNERMAREGKQMISSF